MMKQDQYTPLRLKRRYISHENETKGETLDEHITYNS